MPDTVPSDELVIWTICQNPSDYPGLFTMRPHYIARKTIGPVLTAETLEGIRALLPPNVIRLPRAIEDDQVIVECWL